MIRLRNALLTLGVVLGALALAQSEAPPSEPPLVTDESEHATPPPPPGTVQPPLDGPETSDRGYPLEYVQRPLALPGSMLEVGISLGGGPVSTGLSGGATAAVRYGVTSWFQLAANTSLTGVGGSSLTWRGVGLGALFPLLRGGTELGAGVSANLLPFGRRPLSSVALDLPFRVRFGNLSLTTGNGLLRYQPGDPVIGNSSIGTAVLEVRAAFQLHSHVAVFAGSDLVTLYGFGFLNGISLFHPLAAGLVVSPSARLDLSAGVIGVSLLNYPSAYFNISFRP